MKKTRDQNLKILGDIKKGVMPLSSLIPQKQKLILIQGINEPELSKTEIDELITEHRQRFPDSDCLPVRMLIVRRGQTFNSMMKDMEDAKDIKK